MKIGVKNAHFVVESRCFCVDVTGLLHGGEGGCLHLTINFEQIKGL